ncbi:MAG TPA: LPS export ABC transporter periplasmic protein LptC [Pseudomonadaceae bacterium]|nr:LPS export ABC transporter periplasmic protein LptC [Pseudomonadaceae bacterium]
MNKRLLTAAAILLAFIAFAVIGTRDSSTLPPDSLASHLQAEYDYYINDMQLDRFEPGAQHSHSLKATRVTHFPEAELSLLEEPRMTWYDAEQSPWHLDAQQGEMTPLAAGDGDLDGDLIVLSGNVLARTLGADGAELRISTQSLDVVPTSKSAHTALLVRIEDANMHMLGTGMDLDMTSKRIRLLSDVSARHEAPEKR